MEAQVDKINNERDELVQVIAQLLASGFAPKQARVVRIWGRDRVDASAGAEANIWAGTPEDLATEVADAALAWFAEHVEALIDRYDDPGYGMQEDEWRFVRDLRALYATPTTESEGR